MNELEYCIICNLEYNESTRIPRLMSCSHTACEECLITVYRQSGKRRCLQCPVCRKIYHFKKEASFSTVCPQNRYINKHLQQKRKVEELQDICSKHDKNNVFFCTEPKCQSPLCQLCFLKDHREHNVSDLEESKTAFKKHIKLLFDEKTCHLNTFNQEIIDKIKEVEDNRDDVLKALRRVRDLYVQRLNEAVDEIEEEMNEAFNSFTMQASKDKEPILKEIDFVAEMQTKYSKLKMPNETLLKSLENVDKRVLDELNDDSEVEHLQRKVFLIDMHEEERRCINAIKELKARVKVQLKKPYSFLKDTAIDTEDMNKSERTIQIFVTEPILGKIHCLQINANKTIHEIKELVLTQLKLPDISLARTYVRCLDGRRLDNTQIAGECLTDEQNIEIRFYEFVSLQHSY